MICCHMPCCADDLLSHALLQLDKMDASARSKAEMAQKIAQELLKSSGHRMGMTSQHMPALNSEQSNIVRAAQQKAAEIAIQASLLHAPVCIAPLWSFLQPYSKPCCKSSEKRKDYVFWRQFDEKPSIIPCCLGCKPSDIVQTVVAAHSSPHV